VTYNEIDTGVVELLRKIKADGVTDEFFQWIDRDTFHALKNGIDWKAGLMKTCWSFGNNQITYLFGNHIEEIKREAHEYLMSNGYDRTAKTRITLLREFKEKAKISGRFDLEQLERLQQLGRLERLERLELLNMSFSEVEITTPTDQTVVYCDIPYMTETSVKKYKKESNYYGRFDYSEFISWVQKSPFKVYVSSYDIPELEEVFSVNKRILKNHKGEQKLTKEKLYVKPIGIGGA
jgi:site-specific DNA-adenine methylase